MSLASLVNALAVQEAEKSFWERVEEIWKYPFATIDGQPITPGTIVIGLVFFALGMALARILSRLVSRRLLSKFEINEGLAAIIQALLFYVLLVVFTLLAFQVANIPLTAFTLLGGALAIGLGFGSQNVINNFISGLILLAERPVNVGDLVQIGDLYGRVENIGARSTRVRTGEDVEIVVPNSTFLEQNVINWSLSGSRVRIDVKVGVAYGSDLEKVTELLMKAARETPSSHEKPEPVVAFTDFGDNALAFEVHFWITMRSVMDRRMAESDVRYRVDGLFREAGVTISFPQRDVHLDTLQPLEVRVTSS